MGSPGVSAWKGGEGRRRKRGDKEGKEERGKGVWVKR